MKKTAIFAEGLMFPEAPRWHGDKLWFSDMNAGWVMTIDLSGNLEAVIEVPGFPSGLGWLPDGRLLVVSMVDRRLLRLDPPVLTEVANLFDTASYHLNDMVVDSRGRAYIGNFGFDLARQESFAPAEIILVEQGGGARAAAEDMAFPNGSVITPGGETLIVGESLGRRLTAFTIAEDGSLEDRRLWADVSPATPDGICLDVEGGIWVASPETGEVIRIKEGGTITDRLVPSARPFACMLGGPDRQTLFVCTSKDAAYRGGRIESVEADVPGAGLP